MLSIIIDLDGTLTLDEADRPYPEKKPNDAVVAQLRAFRALGYRVVVHSARNMRTHAGQIGLLNVHTLPIVLNWLQEHDVPFDEVILGKPWCGEDGFYVDDRAIRPSEFSRLRPEEIRALLDAERENSKINRAIMDTP